MTAKQKATELIETAKNYVHGYVGSSFMTNHEYPEQILNQSKKVANIIVDEIINEVKNEMHLDWIPTRKNGEEFVEYWEKVKAEIDSTVLDVVLSDEQKK